MRKYLIIIGLCLTALSIFGVVILYSTTLNAADAARFDSQLKWFGAGLVILPLLIWADYGWWQRLPLCYLLAAGCIITLLAVFIPGIGMEKNGSHRWLHDLGQPSEFAKPVVIILLSAWLARHAKKDMADFKNDFLKPLLIGGVPAALIFAEPDWGTAVLIGSVTFLLLMLAGARFKHLVQTMAIAAVILGVSLVFNQVRRERVLVFLNPEANQHGAGWQIWQSLLAIGSGGLCGDFFSGSVHKFGYVPEQQTDFIFARLGEETGLWGATLVVALFAVILWCGLQITKNARDAFGRFLAAGCTSLIALQAGINIAVDTSLVPNKGLPLPFVSYGGSGLIAMFICAGLLGSVAWHSSHGQDWLQTPNPRPVPIQLMLF